MKIVSAKEIYKCALFSVSEEEAVEKDGFRIKRNVIRHPGSAVIMAVDRKKRVLLVKQYRLPADAYLWELPAGKIDEGETALQAAKRELKEETGYKAKTWKKLLKFFASPGYVAEQMTIYLATDLQDGEATPMEDEKIEKKWFTKKALTAMIRSNEIVDAKTMLGYFCRAKLK